MSFIINGAFFPDILNISVWTHSDQIHYHWQLILIITFGGIGLIILFLNLNSSPKYKFNNYPKCLLVQTNNKMSRRLVIGYLIYIVLLSSLLMLGILGQNYGSLFVFQFLGIYFITFYRFMKIRIGEPGRKYQIVEGEK